MSIVFYSKNGCPFCNRLEDLLKELGLPYNKIIPQPNSYDDLKKKTKMNTFPMIYIGEELIGGYTEFNTLCLTNELQKKLKLIGIDLEV